MNYYENLSHGTHQFPIGIHYTECPDGFKLYPHIHNEFEFLVLQSGKGVIYIDDTPHEISAGDAVFINSHQLHFGVPADAEKANFFAVVFSPEILGSYGDNLIFNKYILPVIKRKLQFPEVYTCANPWQASVIETLNRIYAAYSEGAIACELEIKSLITELWRICYSNSHKCAISRDITLENMKKAFEFIQNEYSSPLTLDEIASQINMSKGYFCRKFSEMVHMTPFEYLLRIRIENSCRMLSESSLSIGEIAQHCGFNSFSYFSKMFKQLMGCTPREYIKISQS